jgi:aminoglycoside 3-N-acetyltransferase
MPSHTRTELAQNLLDLGVRSGDMLFVHSSFKSLGPVHGAAQSVVGALQDSIGATGMLLMPSFNLVDRARRAETWDPATTPSTVGWLTEYFRQLPDTCRSDHYSHSVAIHGPGARDMAAGHLLQKGCASPWDLLPWGKTYGLHSPMYRAYQSEAKLLMLGVDYATSTYIHLVEVLYWHTLRALDPTAAFPGLQRDTLGAFWDRTGDLQRGLVGDAPSRLFSIRKYVDALLTEVEKNAGFYLR